LLHPFFWLPAAQLTIHHPEQGTLAIERTPWGHKIRLAARAEHTPRIETEILLPEDVKRIELCNVVEVELLYAKQASYFAFPWALERPTFRYDIANGFVDPSKDLLEGACSDWFSLQQAVNVQDSAMSIDLAVADSPLVCLGDINRGSWRRQFTNSSSTIFSYLMNNYWSSKYAGQKTWELTNRYAITSGTRFEPGETERFGLQTRTPMEVGDIKSSDKLPARVGTLPPAHAGFVELTPGNLVLTALKVAEDGHGLVARVRETSGRPTQGVLRLPLMQVTSANEANAVEVAGKSLAIGKEGVRFDVKPNQVLTLRLNISVPPPARRAAVSQVDYETNAAGAFSLSSSGGEEAASVAMPFTDETARWTTLGAPAVLPIRHAGEGAGAPSGHRGEHRTCRLSCGTGSNHRST